jgi:polyisoprenyl-teichoic acid--peptidoglycan teichoic acid transferase
MAGQEKPYRVYRGGRAKGKVPLQTRPGRPTPGGARRKDGAGSPRYPGPGPRQQPRRPRWRRRIGIALVLLLVLFLVWAVASYFAFASGVGDARHRLPAGSAEALTQQNALLLSTPTNILLLGTDHANQTGHESANRSDSIMLLRTDPSRHRISYLSIPRDLRVPIPGIGDSKVNAAMQSGGPRLAIQTIQSYTGLPINHVIIVDFARFKEVIDAIGGVTVDVPERIISKFDCPYSTEARCSRWEGWRFAKGPQHMDGKRALIYSRVRKNSLNAADTDITRTERQQDVLQAMLHKLTSVSTLVKFPFIGSKLVAPLATDLSAAQFLQIGWVYKRSHALHCRLGGTTQTLADGESVIVSEGDDKARVILAMLGRTAPLPPRPGEGPYGAGCVSGNAHFGG